MFFGLNLDGVFMPDFTTKLKKKCAALRLYLYICWNRFCRQSTSGSCLILLQNFKKKWAAFRLYLYVFWNRFCRQSTSAYQISYIFLLSFGTKNKNKKTASHGCAEIPAGIPAGIPQLTGRLQKNLVLCPAVPAPKGTVAVRAAGPLDIYIRRSGV